MTWNPSEYRRLEPLLAAASTALLVTHVHPDADGVGSGVALLRYLRQRGLTARFLVTHPLPLSLQFLAPEGEAEAYVPGEMSDWARAADLVITLDNSSVERLGPLREDIAASRARRVCIDHHLVREPFWQLNLIDESATATGEMVHDCIRELGGTIDPVMAQGIYTAIWSDTGGFRFPKTSPRIHRLAAELLERGVEPHRVYHQLNERNSPESLRLLAAILQQVRFGAGGRLAWVEVPRALQQRCGETLDDPSEALNHMLAIEGVEIGLLLREEPDGRTKISLRSEPRHNVHALAAVHGGGGHRNAAGAVIPRPLERCAETLVAEAEAALDA